MICTKTHINDSLASKFCDAFWSELKISLLISYKKIFLPGELSISQKRVVIKLIEKKGRDWSNPGGQYLYLILMQNLFLKFYQKELKTFIIFNILKPNCLRG